MNKKIIIKISILIVFLIIIKILFFSSNVYNIDIDSIDEIKYEINNDDYNVFKDTTKQSNINDIILNIDTNELILTHKYYGKAKILSKEYYYNDELSDLIPIDLVFGWKEMAIKENYERTNITQKRRWYYWKVRNFFISRQDIEHNSANTHIIPINQNLMDRLNDLKVDDVISFTSYLVNINYNKNKTWKSSKKRTDIGTGSCETILLLDFEIIEKE